MRDGRNARIGRLEVLTTSQCPLSAFSPSLAAFHILGFRAHGFTIASRRNRGHWSFVLAIHHVRNEIPSSWTSEERNKEEGAKYRIVAATYSNAQPRDTDPNEESGNSSDARIDKRSEPSRARFGSTTCDIKSENNDGKVKDHTSRLLNARPNEHCNKIRQPGKEVRYEISRYRTLLMVYARRARK